MTNKEAFEKMVELCNFYHHTIVKDADITFVCDYRIDNIRKDLEVLEILKKYSYSHDNRTLFIALECMNIDELEKVKDWLEK